MSSFKGLKIAILGAGSWGTALGDLLAQKGFEVYLWARRKEVVQAINQQRENPYYLPQVKLSPRLRASTDMERVLAKAAVVILAIPSHALRQVLEENKSLLAEGSILVSTIKGIEEGSLLTMSQVIREILSDVYVVVLSGPSFAEEVVQKRPTAVTVAGDQRDTVEKIQHLFATPYFRAYLSRDVLGVELAGALKNVIAIAVGISDGLGLGLNARAALITRGLAEISRLGVQLGANPLTFSGLAGLGDLVLTCTGPLSRNRTVGLRLGQGEKLPEILKDLKQVAEGVRTTSSARHLAQKHGIEMPITEAVYQVLYHQKDPLDMAHSLLSRRLKEEFEF